MNKKLQLLLAQMKSLEEEIEKTLSEKEEQILLLTSEEKLFLIRRLKLHIRN